MISIRNALLCTLLLAASSAQAADKIVAAGNKLSAIAPLYIGVDKGLFAAQGLDVSLVHLTSSQEIALAVVSGSASSG
jgi:ABC-type nitrate/sulfonate/bicarbonate transport system substrate-binding protein